MLAWEVWEGTATSAQSLYATGKVFLMVLLSRVKGILGIDQQLRAHPLHTGVVEKTLP